MRQNIKQRIASLAAIIIAGGILVAGTIAISVHGAESDGQNQVLSDTATTTPSVTPEATATPVATATPTPAATATPTPKPAEPSVAVTLDYVNEVLTVSKGPLGSTEFYISTDKQKTWQVVSNTKMDLAVFMKTSDNTIYFKGNKDLGITEVTIPKEDKSLKIKYVVENGKGTLEIANASGASLQYRKGATGDWMNYDPSKLNLADYEMMGYTLQFRTKATTSTRAGKIVSVKIAKRPNPPTIKVDYSDFTISGLKAGNTMYRIAGSSQWTLFNPKDSKEKTLDLAALLLPSGTVQNTVPIPGNTLEFYTPATDKKVASGIRVVQTVTQPAAPTASSVSLNQTTLTFTNASKTVPYEYVVLHKNETLDIATAKWKKVTNSKQIIIKKVGTASPIPGDKIYYRLASVTDSKTKEVTPASMYGTVDITAVVAPSN